MLRHSSNKTVCVIGRGAVANSIMNMLTDLEIPATQRDAEFAMTAEDCVDFQYLIGIVKATAVRHQVICWLKQQQLNCPAFVHQQAFVASNVDVGNGTIIFPHANVLNSKIGEHCMFTPFSHVGHQSLIGDSCLFLPYSSTLGSTTISSFTALQTRSTVLDTVQITAESVNILPSSLVTKDIDKTGTYGGSPARLVNANTTQTAQYFNQ